MIRNLIKPFYYWVQNKLQINQILYNVPKSTIFPHRGGIYISPKVLMGENCVIYQNVTIGSKSKYIKQYPIIGNNVIIYSNSVVFGNIVIGDNSVIGAGSVISKDVLPNKVVGGVFL